MAPRSSDEIRSTFLDFFAEREHLVLPSFSLVPATEDPSVLLTTAGMHPLKGYFLGEAQPPAQRLTDCQKCFRTPDIDEVGLTTRHLTFFEMLGNFSMGDYFKREVVRFAWDLTLEGFGFDPEQVWITVFEGDDQLGLGPDEEAIDAWLEVGVPRERIVECNRAENFWQAGPIGPCGPCSELYLDRGLEFGKEDDLPGGENERFLEFWNLVFMQYRQDPANVLTPLPKQNIDTGMGLNRMAAILQDVETVFDTDQLKPLVDLGVELSGRSYGTGDADADRAFRILADHTRGMSFLVADGVTPSNEGRGYVLRRLMRRAVVQAKRVGIGEGVLPKFAEVVRETMGGYYGELHEQRESIERWLRTEEESFGRTIESGTKLLDEVIAKAKANGQEGIAADDAFLLHDTYGFPIDLTVELAAEQDLGVDHDGFSVLMDGQRARARAAATGGAARDAAPADFARGAGFTTEFRGYADLEARTAVGALGTAGDRTLVKLVESPFYAAGGGQVSDDGVLEGPAGVARVRDVLRVGDDQVLVVEGPVEEGPVVARVDRGARHATQCNHTATHLLHAALRQVLGTHVRQAGSAVQPDKLRFDFTHGERLTESELREVEELVVREVLANKPVRAISTTLDEARSLGAMALFGEKYGDVVRMVEVGDGSWSRELCGGTHVRSTAEIGAFRITAETSSAANVRRIEAVTGPAAVGLLRLHDQSLLATAEVLRCGPEDAPAVAAKLVAERKQLTKQLESGGGAAGDDDEAAALAGGAVSIGGASVVLARAASTGGKALVPLADRIKSRLGEAGALVLVGADGERIVAQVTKGLTDRLDAGALLRAATDAAGGKGGGHGGMAQGGGLDPAKTDVALDAARAAIESALGG